MTVSVEQVLTDEQVRFFAANGYLHIPGLVPPDELDDVRRDMAAMIERGLESVIDDSNYRYGVDGADNDRKCLYRISYLIRRHNVRSVKLLMAYPPLLGAIHQAVGHDHFVIEGSSCVFKIPRRGYPVPWHQDPCPVYRFPVFNVDIYLDASAPDNGCLYVIPGSHLAGYHGTPRFVEAWTEGKETDAPGAVPVIAEPGDVVFHATSVLHGSFWNRSDSQRRTIYSHINHYRDVMARDADDNRRRSYLEFQQLTADAIELRRATYPHESGFEYSRVTMSD